MLFASVCLAWAADPGYLGGVVDLSKPQAGQAIRFNVSGGDDTGNLKVSFTLERPDGSRQTLPPMEITPPLPTPPAMLEGPVLPRDCGGSVLIVEVIEMESGRLYDTGGAPVGF